RAAGVPIVHADALADQARGLADRPVLAGIEVAGGEIPQRKDRQRDKAAVAVDDAAEVTGHRGLAAVDTRVAGRALQHLDAAEPRALLAVYQGQVDPGRL